MDYFSGIRNDENSKMSGLVKQISEAMEVAKLRLFLSCKSEDTEYGSLLWIKGSFDPVSTWVDGVCEKSRYFLFWIYPIEAPYYEEGQKILIALITSSDKIPKYFIKFRGTPDEVIAKLIDWLKTAVD